MLRVSTLIGLFIGIKSPNSFACDCMYAGPFFEMTKNTPLVALVKVIKYLSFKDINGQKTPMSMEVEIIEKYKGQEYHKSVTVWGDNGTMCRPYLSTFKEGLYFVIAFYPGIANNGYEGEKNTDYFIANCGAYWLTVDYENKKASGDIDGKNTLINLSALKSK